MRKKYNYLIVGAGLFGSTLAQILAYHQRSVLVVDKRSHIGGNIYTEKKNNIDIHKYGAHIFHTNDKDVWDYITRFDKFNNFINRPIANYKGEIYSLPFNMYTFNKLWGVVTPEGAKQKILSQSDIGKIPENLEEQAIHLVGRDIYEKLIKGYTEKQWGRDCKDLPVEIINRLPVRFTYDNNYFNAKYQGIPIHGYTYLINRMLNNPNIFVSLNTDYLEHKFELDNMADFIIYTGPIDAYFNYEYGHLQYRTCKFSTYMLDTDNVQGNAVVNYTSTDVPWTRVIEHKHFNPDNISDVTYITKEYPVEYIEGISEPLYPVIDKQNNMLYNVYCSQASKLQNIVFGGRLGTFKYNDMDVTIKNAMQLSKVLLNENK